MKTKEVIKEIFKNIKSSWYMPVIEKQVYSEQETVVGVWIDGKPLYRKVLITTGTTIPKGDVSPDIDQIVYLRFRVVGMYNGQRWHLYDSIYQNEGAQARVTYDGTNINIARGSVYDQDKETVVTVEYTKTTDTPTSQSKVPFEPLTEYSTEEKMIGWWIDGKPVYRRVIDGLNIATKNGWYWENIVTVPDIGKIISCRVFHGGVLTEAVEAKIGNSVVQVSVPYGRTLTGIVIEYTKTTD